ncbi:ABC transporter substrate-binding protein [Tomitella biformata]|uniref:ABC transporter substrate-binding protein n=1 Tax=Tomitella biformata TaxID=630403 RepID=UPI000463810B|nr:ABC transporter substrate-binding protein [Tomitella biformata]
MKITFSTRARRAIVGGLAAALALAGCSSAADSADGSDGPAAGVRVIEIQGASYEIPAEPQRLVGVHNASIQPILEAGGTLVAAAQYPESIIAPGNRAAYAAIPEKFDVTDGVNTEQVLTFSPDLVLAIDRNTPEELAHLEAAGPLAIFKVDGEARSDWRGRVAGAGEILGTSDKVDALEKKYQDRAAQIKSEYAAELAANKIVVISSWDNTGFTAYGPDSMAGRIFTDAGATFIDAVQDDSGEKSPGEFIGAFENLGDVTDAGIVLVGSNFEGEYDEFQRTLVESPLLSANAKVVAPVGLTTVSGYSQAFYMLDQFEAALQQTRGA